MALPESDPAGIRLLILPKYCKYFVAAKGTTNVFYLKSEQNLVVCYKYFEERVQFLSAAVK